MAKNYVRNCFKIGGSLGITLPLKYCIENMISHGTRVYIEADGNKLLIEVLNPENFKKMINEAPKKKDNDRYIKPHIISKKITNEKHQSQQKGRVKW